MNSGDHLKVGKLRFADLRFEEKVSEILRHPLSLEFVEIR